MKFARRSFLHLAATAAALPAVSRFASAQTYPSRPVRIVVGFAAGSSPDITARLMAQWLSERLGQQFIIDNRPGAGTNIATEVVVRAPLMVIRFSGSPHRAPSTRRFTTNSISILSEISRPSLASSRHPT